MFSRSCRGGRVGAGSRRLGGAPGPGPRKTSAAHARGKARADRHEPITSAPVKLRHRCPRSYPLTEGATVLSREYDGRGRLAKFTTSDGDEIGYRYDAYGNLIRLIYPDGKQVNYAYNSRNLLETVTDWGSRTTTYQYDRLGRLTGILRPNGTSATIAHDAAGQITELRESSSGKLISLLRFDHDAAGQIERRFRAPLVQSGWQHPAVTASYDDDNRLASFNGQSVIHDADGNMTFGPIAPDSGSVNLAYNSRNQLVSAGGNSYAYDAEGRRRTIIDSSGTTRDVIDPNSDMSRLLVRHHPGGGQTYYVYGLGLLYEVDGSENTTTYHFDQVGSTILRTDGSGKEIGWAEYSAYGLIVRKSGDMNTPFLYNGQLGIITDSNGLLYMRSRYYSPFLMRFLNADPIGFSGGMNWFAYADGNPISGSDPFGLWSWKQTFGVLKAMGGMLEVIAGVALGAATSWTGVGAVRAGVCAGGTAIAAEAPAFRKDSRGRASGLRCPLRMVGRRPPGDGRGCLVGPCRTTAR